MGACEAYRDRISAYLDGELTGEERRELLAHLEICGDCRMYLDSELAIRAARLREELLMECGEEPGVEELAERLGVEPEELVQAMDGSAEVESLQKIVYQGDGEGLSLMDKVDQGKDEEETLLRQLLLEQLLSSLEPKERRLIVLRFFHDRTQTQVAEELGMSQVQVSRLEKKILQALKKRM